MMDHRSEFEDLKIYFDEIRKFPVLTHEEEIDLGKKMREEDSTAAFNKLVISNLKLVVRIAENYMGLGLPLSDLISEGNLGLIHAVEKYNYRKGNKFSSYSSWWIKQSILRAIACKSRTIRLPVRRNEILGQVYRAFDVLADRNKTIPTEREISEEINIPYLKLVELLAIQKTSSLESLSEVNPDSLSFADIKEDLEEKTDSHFLGEKLEKILRTVLSKRELDIIYKRKGFNGYEVYTLEMIGDEYGLTRERIRQIEQKAIRKLKNNPEARKLVSYLER